MAPSSFVQLYSCLSVSFEMFYIHNALVSFPFETFRIIDVSIGSFLGNMMAITSGILPEEGIISSPTRNPLQIKTTSPSPASTLKQVRRKDSFLRHADSSDDYPSPHESIFEAFYFSATNSDESNSRIELITLYPHGPPNDENRGPRPQTPPAPTPMDDIQFRYGHGTVLETIAEQKSSGTRTVSRTKSLDSMPSFPFLNHRDSFMLARSPRRKQSFSLDDLALINRYYHEACATIEKDTCKPIPLEVTEIYAQPKKPLHPPPERPSTPPGMPSWTAAQNIPPRGRISYAPTTQNRFQRFFGISPSGIAVSSRVPQPPGPGNARDRAVSAPTRGRTPPRFRPPRSVYGPLDQHPFTRAPVAQILPRSSEATPAQTEISFLTQSVSEPSVAEMRRQKSRRRRLTGQKVRFTPSATQRDSEALALQSAIEATTATAVHPLSVMQAMPQPQNSPFPEPCHHRGNRLKKTRSQSAENNYQNTALGIEYTTLPPESPTRQELIHPMGPRQYLSPIISRTTIGSSSPTIGESLVFGDAVPTTPEADSRVSSVNSTAPLMSGALRSMVSTPDLARLPQAVAKTKQETKAHWCWRCKLENGCQMVDRWWMNSMSFVCFVCCGFDVNEDGSVTYSDLGATSDPYVTGMRGGGGRPRCHTIGPRRVILGQSAEMI